MSCVVKNYQHRQKGQKTRNIGQLYDDLVFRKNVNSVEHQLRIPPAWAMDELVLKDLEKRHCKKIVFYDTAKKVTWLISPQYFRDHMIRPFDRHHGKQVACELKYWVCVNPPEMRIEPIKEQARQPRLLEVIC